MPERLIGRTLGKYRVESLLGTGGFAWVFAASDPDLGVTVALKVLKPQYAGDVEFESRFRREASTAARLKHPNIIKIYTVGSEDKSVYFAMDMYTQKLTQQIGVMGSLPETAVLKLGLDISSALGFAHRQGVIHRDIKADNILFDDHGNAIVADFGIARAAANYAEQTGTNVIMGTPQFFAPEQARGHNIDARADIYSLGVTLFVAATGKLPFDGTDWYEIATKHVQEPPPAPRSINPSISPEMEGIILKCMEKDREDRYETADLLYGDLESLARRRAGDVNASTIMISTPVTGRFQLIQPTGARRGGRYKSALAILGSFVIAAAVFLFVEGYGMSSLNPLNMVAIVIGGDQVEPGGAGGGSDTPGGGGRSSQSGGNPGRGGTSTLPRQLFSVEAPAEAAILVNGNAVGRGAWSTDTFPPGNYRVTAQLVVASDCRWAQESTVVVFSGTMPATAKLNPRACGKLELVVTRDNNPIAAGFELRWDNGELILEDRVPMTAPVVVPQGTHILVVRAPLCTPYRDTIPPGTRIVAESTTTRTIRILCGVPFRH